MRTQFLDSKTDECNKIFMRILLISANTETMNMPVLPLGMASVAAATEMHGHHVHSLNLLESDNIPLSVQTALRKINPDAIGISVRNIDDQSMDTPKFLLDPVKHLVDTCRTISGAPVLLGGAGYSIFPQSALDYTAADYGIQGEGEETLPLLLDFLNAGRNPSCIPGVYARGLKRDNPPRFSNDINRFPLPRPDVHIDIPKAFDQSDLWMPYQTRRGCPMKCSYCSTPIIEGTNIRSHDTDAIIENIARFAAKGIEQFFFVDNIFNIPQSYAEHLCDAIIDANLNIRWRCILYPHRINETLAQKMAQAGCVHVSLGFESGSVTVLEQLNKNYSPDDVLKTARILNDHGIAQMGFLLLGGPGETRETIRETLELSDMLPIDTLKITVGIRIYPGTPLAATAVTEGTLSGDDNLLMPRFYLRPQLSTWLQEYIHDWAASRPHCIF